MNKNRHRILFNKARGILMAVAECAASHSRGDARPGTADKQPEAGTVVRFAIHPLACAMLGFLGCTVGFAPYAEAQIVGDPNAPKNQQATILNAGNGIPLVNIQTPSAAGVSRNTYSQFDVQANGAILNNARVNAQTQLGGWVQGNPWLATGSARVILNEVNSANPSLLRGYVEVAGGRAQVVIANPAGVTCDGCGFINANRVTLTTGTPLMNGGSLDGYRIEGGQIQIQGNGLDSRQVDYTDLIARAVTVNAGLWANNLKIVTGANQVDSEAGSLSPLAGTGAAPVYALDVGQLGGMYAGKITLVGNENGVGVRNAGQIAAAIGGIILTSEGRLLNSGSIGTTAQALNIVSSGVDNSGTLTAQSDIAINSRSELTNSGLINAGRELKADIAGQISNSGTIAGQRLDLAAERLDNRGSIRQTGSQGLVLGASSITNQAGATLGHLPTTTTATGSSTPGQQGSPAPDVSAPPAAPTTAVAGGTASQTTVPEVLADGRIALRGELLNAGQLNANGRFDSSASRLDNQGSVNLDNLNISGDRLLNAGGKLLATNLSVNTPVFDNQGGQINVSSNLAMQAAEVNNAQGTIIHAGSSNLGIQISGALNNQDGTLSSNTNQLKLNAASIDNSRGLIISKGQLAITATQGNLLNDSRLLIAEAGLSATASGTLSNNAGQIVNFSSNPLQLTAATLSNNAGLIQSAGDLELALTSNFANSPNSKLLAGGNFKLATQGTFSNSATLYAANKLDLSAASISNQAGGEISAGTAKLTTPGDLTNNGKITAAGQLDLSAANIDNQASGEISATTTRLSTPGTLTNRGLIDGSATEINAGTLNNLGSGRIYGDHLSIAASNLNNTNENAVSPTIAARSRLDLAVPGVLNNDLGALIFSAGGLAIGGSLDANREASGRAGTINNNGGTIQALGGLVITAQAINNNNPNFSATITSGPTVNQTTYITSQGTFTADQVGWMVDNLGWNGTALFAGNSSPNQWANELLIIVKKGSTYADPVYAGDYNRQVYSPETTKEVVDSMTLVTSTITIPAEILSTLSSSDPIWARYSITPPSSAPATTSRPVAPLAPTATTDPFTGLPIPPTPAQISAWEAAHAAWQAADAAWQAAAAPYIALQNALSNMTGTVTATSRLVVYSYVQESYQPLIPQVISSSPGQILAGGNMTLDASSNLTNDKSRIIAGGALNLAGLNINNIAAQFSGTETHSGTSASWAYAGHIGASTGNGCDCDTFAFKGTGFTVDIPVTLDAPIAVVLQNQSPGGSNSIPGQNNPASHTNPATRSTSPGAFSVPVNLSIPASSLYLLHPGPTGGYLIETDPRFANYRNWLSSDYMLQQLSFDPANVHKRLGDGFYEQQLIREQIAQLTGQRFLTGYASDEAQYLALMNNGATLARAWNLRPGISLSAAQVAQLTSDIVWLVEQTVSLPDGTRQNVLVPQIYLAPRSGDLKADGTLLAGNTIKLAASGDFTNSGTVAGRSLVNLSANNLKNLGGLISADQVDLKATNDLDNIGGRISASSELKLNAGRDINLVTTTQTGTGQSQSGNTTGQFSSTRLDRLAGLYVTGQGGTLSAVAGRDINLTAGEVKNTSGNSQLIAGRDIKLNTLTESQQSDIRYSQGNTAKFGYTKEIGSTLASGGNLALVAGRDLNARAATLDAGKDLALVAGRDITLEAGRNEQNIEINSQRSNKSGGFFGKTRTTTTAFKEERSDAVGATLTGQNISLQSGRDTTLEATRLKAGEQINIDTGRDLTLAAGESTLTRHIDNRISTQENILPGKQSLKTTRDESWVTPEVAQLSGRNIKLTAGGDMTLVAPQIKATEQLSASAGEQLTLAAATATHELKETSEFKTNRFNVSEVTAPITGKDGAMNASGHPDDKTFVTGGRIKDKIKLAASDGERSAVVADIEAKDIKLNSGGDTLLVAPSIRAETLSISAGQIDGEIVNPNARIQFLGVKESTSNSSSKNSHSFVHETVRDGGSNKETLQLPDIILTGNPTVDPQNPPKTALALNAPGGIVVGATPLAPTQKELKATLGQTNRNPANPPAGIPYDLKSQASTLAQQPGLAWLGELAQRQDVDWQAIELARQSWDYKHAGLTQEGAVIVVIVVAILTAGWGSSLAGAEGAAVLGGSAEAGLTATATTTLGDIALSSTVTSAGVTTTTYTAAGAALNAGFTTLASQTAVSLINNQGDIGKTLQDLGSKDNIKQLVASMLTAGVGGYYSGTYNLESFLAKTATGCAVGELIGSSCGQGAATAGTMAGFAWASDAMKRDQIINSQQFKGICLGETDNCSNNFERGEIGGGRWDLATVCRTTGFSCSVREDGYVKITSASIDEATKMKPFDALQAIFKENGGDLLSPAGGHQGSQNGYLKFFGVGPGDYNKGSFWAKWVVEPTGGPHDWSNSFSAYDTVNGMSEPMEILDFKGVALQNQTSEDWVKVPRFVGNIRPDYGSFAKFMNVIDIPLAAPFAAATIVDQLPPGMFQTLINARKNAVRDAEQSNGKTP